MRNFKVEKLLAGETKYCENNGINLIRFKYNEPINFNIIANKKQFNK